MQRWLACLLIVLVSSVAMAEYPPDEAFTQGPFPVRYVDPDANPIPGPVVDPGQPQVYVYPGYHRHDGFLARFTAGVGFGSGRAELTYNRYAFKGVTSMFDLSLGYSVLENFALTLDFYGLGQFYPITIADGRGTRQVTATLETGGFGIGATYFMMPANLYLQLGLSMSGMGMEITDSRWTSGAGIGFQIALGKEWWVAPDWGLGFAMKYFMTHIPNPVGSWNSHVVGLAFSATYN